MSKEILINVTPQEIRVAILENGMLHDLYIERSRSRGLVGNVYKGKVVRVLPGMEAAFVDIGLEKAAFLHVSDVARKDNSQSKSHSETVHVDQVLREGQSILVQVLKDQLGTKGARLTTNITIPSRYLVFMPNADNIGVSSRIENEEDRLRLKNELLEQEHRLEGAGYILRTAAETAEKDAIASDIKYLNRLWSNINSTSEIKAGNIVHKDLPLFLRVLRDMVDEDIEVIRVDSRETYLNMLEFAENYVPEVADFIEHYPGERPVFDLHGVEDEIQKGLERKGMLIKINLGEILSTSHKNNDSQIKKNKSNKKQI